VLAAVGESIGMDRVMVRFSELKDDQPDFRWQDPKAEIEAYLQVFRQAGVRVLHPSTNTFIHPMAEGMTLHELVRKHWDGAIIGVGGLTPSSAAEAIHAGVIDVAAFGKPLLANADFVQRLRHDQPLVPYKPDIHLQQLL
jgi:2,4-dienoyl-CoA reductase-like NADH-dependent reductase (Old Yellow Enzyme family)